VLITELLKILRASGGAGAGLYQLENLADLSALPETGAFLVVAPIKLEGGVRRSGGAFSHCCLTGEARANKKPSPWCLCYFESESPHAELPIETIARDCAKASCRRICPLGWGKRISLMIRSRWNSTCPENRLHRRATWKIHAAAV